MMSNRTRVPVRVRRVPSAYEIMRDPYGRSPGSPLERARKPGPGGQEAEKDSAAPETEREGAPAPSREPRARQAMPQAARPRGEVAADGKPPGRPPEPNGGESPSAANNSVESVEEWRDRALRLQAEIENFRKRQQRLSEERIRDDRERLLRAFLTIGDDLERALEADGSGGQEAGRLREGVALIHQGFLQVLAREGVEPIEALGQPFDPTLHDGIATIPHEHAGLEANRVAQVVTAGYTMGDRLLRPARVVVTA